MTATPMLAIVCDIGVISAAAADDLTVLRCNCRAASPKRAASRAELRDIATRALACGTPDEVRALEADLDAITRPAAQVGAAEVWAQGETVRVGRAAAPAGTTVTVRGLFAGLPARLLRDFRTPTTATQAGFRWWWPNGREVRPRLDSVVVGRRGRMTR